jgi:hypothetical protein
MSGAEYVRADITMPGGRVARDIAITPAMQEMAARAAGGDLTSGLTLLMAVQVQELTRGLFGGRRGR